MTYRTGTSLFKFNILYKACHLIITIFELIYNNGFFLRWNDKYAFNCLVKL